MQWTKELTEMLLMKYQGYENLYNVKHPDYVNRVKRSDALFQIYTELKEKNGKITVDGIKSKLHTLRSQYLKELREVSNSKRSGIGADDVYTPRLWCFDQLEFLRPYCSVRKSTSNIFDSNESKENSTESAFDIDNENQPGFFTKPNDETKQNSIREQVSQPRTMPGTSRKRSTKSSLDEGLKRIKSLLAKRMQENTDYDWLAQQVAFDMNCLKSDQLRRETAWKIQKILREAILANGKINNPPPASQISVEFSDDRSSGFMSTSSSMSFRPVSALSDNACSPDILQQSLVGILDDDDLSFED